MIADFLIKGLGGLRLIATSDSILGNIVLDPSFYYSSTFEAD